MRTFRRRLLAGLILMGGALPAFADDLDELRKLRDTTISLVNALVDEGVLTRAKADEIIAQAQRAGATGAAASAPAAPAASPPPPPAPGVVQIPYVPDTVKQEITDEVKRGVLSQAKTERWGEPGAYPDWLSHFIWHGDFRLREEFDRFPADNTPNASVDELQAFGVNTDDSTAAYNRMRIRARFGFDATIGDTVTVGMGLATGGVGAGGNPGSENQTLGNYESRSTVGFDRAFIAYEPFSWVTLTGGRIGNPFFKPTTLIWANDVSLEGVAALFDTSRLTHGWSVFSTAGLFPILDNPPTPTSSAPDKWLYAYQLGGRVELGNVADFTLATAYYDYRNIQGIPNPSIYSTAYDGTAAPFRQTGNTVFDIDYLVNTQNGTQNYLWGIASQFQELNVSSSLDFRFVGATHVILEADFVDNLGFNQQEILARTGFLVDKQNMGWQTRLAVGDPTVDRRNNWQVWIGYRYAQRDSTLDAFTDQDFHLGGTDAKGYFLGARYAFEKNSTVALRWYSAKQINGVELAGADSVLSGLPYAVDVLQLDVTAAF
jgi:Putative porin